jgi:hypothetical protein
MSIVRDKIKEQRPNIKTSTLDSYYQYLRKLHQMVSGSKDLPTNLDYLRDFEKVEGLMKKYKPNTKKNYYSAIVVALKAFGGDPSLTRKYEIGRDKVQDQYDLVVKSNKKTDKQKANWVSLAEYDALLSKYKADIKSNKLFKKQPLSRKEEDTLKEYIVLLTYRHLPLRNDFVMRVLTMAKYKKLSTEDRESNNFMVGTKGLGYKFHINDYKTKKTFGNKTINIPRPLEIEIKKYMSQNRTGYYLTNSKGEPISANGISKLLNKVFQTAYGKNVSSSMIRHIILSAKYGSSGILDEMKNDSYNMGHSLDTQKDYTKTN